ncbi:MAG: CDP-alcohol phosphatidyltransferase family protein [Bdellovibrionales bacterium]|nr:CDP-alcohol phosphatidyltransferase family protein [Bdellovibrionales bacterium]
MSDDTGVTKEPAATVPQADSVKGFLHDKAKLAAYAVHMLTACGGVLGLFAIMAASSGFTSRALWFLVAAVLIDAVDGTLARRFSVSVHAPAVDGALLDNLVDFVTFVVAPAVLLFYTRLVPAPLAPCLAGLIVFCSAFQFSFHGAKTADHFFTGFPSYWNLAVLYLLLLEWHPWINAAILLSLCALVFAPIKFIYPSRMEFFSRSMLLKRLVLVATAGFGVLTVLLLWYYPARHPHLMNVALLYMGLYVSLSVVRTVLDRPL